MKKGVHPTYEVTTITCACGNKIVTRSTRKNLTVEVCIKCHPYSTGKRKIVDTSGRLEKFMERYEAGKKEEK